MATVVHVPKDTRAGEFGKGLGGTVSKFLEKKRKEKIAEATADALEKIADPNTPPEEVMAVYGQIDPKILADPVASQQIQQAITQRNQVESSAVQRDVASRGAAVDEANLARQTVADDVLASFRDKELELRRNRDKQTGDSAELDRKLRRELAELERQSKETLAIINNEAAGERTEAQIESRERIADKQIGAKQASDAAAQEAAAADDARQDQRIENEQVKFSVKEYNGLLSTARADNFVIYDKAFSRGAVAKHANTAETLVRKGLDPTAASAIAFVNLTYDTIVGARAVPKALEDTELLNDLTRLQRDFLNTTGVHPDWWKVKLSKVKSALLEEGPVEDWNPNDPNTIHDLEVGTKNLFAGFVNGELMIIPRVNIEAR